MRLITRVRRPIMRRVEMRGTPIVLRLHPDGRIEARGKGCSTWWSVDLATLFPDLLRARGVRTLEQLPMFAVPLAAAPRDHQGGATA